MPRIVLAIALICACFWLLWTARQPARFEPRVTRIALSGSGRWLAAGTAQGWIVLADLTGAVAPRHLHAQPGPLNDLRFSPDERHLAAANRNLTLWPVGGGAARVLRDDGSNYGSAGFRPDGRALATITGAGRIEVIDLISRQTLARACCSSIFGEAAFSPDGALVATAGHLPRLWYAASGKLVAALGGYSAPAFGPAVFHPRRGWLIMGSQEGLMRVWDWRTGRLIASSPSQPEWVESIAIAEDSDWIAYAGTHGPVRLWSPVTGALRRLDSARPSSNIALTPGARALAFGTTAGTLEFRDSASGELLRSLPGPHPVTPSSSHTPAGW